MATSHAGRLVDLRVQVTETMPDMPMPARTTQHRICLHGKHFNPRPLLPFQPVSDCHITQRERGASTLAFEEACSVPMALTGHGHFKLDDRGGFTGAIKTAFNPGGDPITITTSYVGKQVGTCR